MSRTPLRILSLDGGPHPLLTILQLRDLALSLEQKGLPGILASTDVIVGNSAGTVSGLYLAQAKQTQPDALESEMLTEAWDFMLGAFDASSGSLDALLKLLRGQTAALSNETLYDVLSTGYGDLTMRDIETLLCIASYDLVSPSHPQLLSNFPLPEIDQSPHYGDLPQISLVDAGMQSGAFPLFFPLYQSHIDAAFVSNSPAMLGVSQVIAAGKLPGHPLEGIGLDDIILLSLGTDSTEFTGKILPQDNENWGWIQWLGPHFCRWAAMEEADFEKMIEEELSLSDPSLNLHSLLLVSALIYGNSMGVRRQCRQLLSDSTFFRLAWPMTHSVGQVMLMMLLGVQSMVYDESKKQAERWSKGRSTPGPYKPSFEQTLDWIEANWLKTS